MGGPTKINRYRFGLFTLDSVEGTLARNGKRLKLQDLPSRLLVMLLERPGEVVTREEMRQRLWPENTFVEFDNSLGVAVRKIRDSLDDDVENPRFIETVPRRGYRFLAPVHADDSSTAGPPAANPIHEPHSETRPRARLAVIVAAAVLIGILIALIGWFWKRQDGGGLAERAPVIVGDFANYTGDPVFDGSLRRAVVIEFAQSPHISVLSDSRIGKMLQDLGRSPEDPLTPAMTRDVCRSGQAAASITGSIQFSGGAYLLSMEADRCADGTLLARQTQSVQTQQLVLTRLSSMVGAMRRKLGESRESLQKFDVPLDQATTSSLEALKAYQLGFDLRVHMKNMEARPAFKTAVALDPNFAIAYAQLGSSYSNLGNTAEAKKYFQKAFELRTRVTEPERLYITGRYFDIVTGEVEKGAEAYKLWTEIYPNDWMPYNAVANDSYQLGRYETVVEASQQAIRLGPNQDFGYSNLLAGLVALNRLDDAKKICEQLILQGHDETFIHLDLLQISYLQQDEASFNREIGWARQRPDAVDPLYATAQAAAAMGKIRESTELYERAAKRDVANGDFESAANVLSTSAETNSEVGMSAVSLRESSQALKFGQNEIVLGLGAIVAARAHQLQKAHELLARLEHDYPLSTFNLAVFSPMIRTTIEVSQKSAAQDVTSLMEPALPYEFGFEADMWPIYVRAVSYLQVHSAEKAKGEFQKIANHHSVDAFSTLYPLSYLGLARAYGMNGDLIESRRAYDRFFELWKNADPDLPILLQARREAETISESRNVKR
jgi:DNA-binding winged helix-turn-helix (wHTH) protein/tetratricopeptide (TPR) repeat protein